VVVHGGRGVDLGIGGTRLDDGVGKRVMGDARCCNAPPVVVRAPALFLSPLLSETHPGSYFFSLAFIIFYSSRLPRQGSFIRVPSVFVLLCWRKRGPGREDIFLIIIIYYL